MDRTPRHHSSHRWIGAAVALIVPLALALPASAQTHVDVLVALDESAGQNPEGIAIDHQGTIFVSVSPLGDLWRIPSGSDEPQPFGHVDGIVPGRDFGLLGLAVDTVGNVYGAVQSADPDVNGVWRFDRGSGDATRLPGTAQIVVPNGLAFDKRGNLFVTGSINGEVWVIPWGGSAELFLQDERLTGNGSLGVFVGVNGIAIHHHTMWLTNTERRTLLMAPIGAPSALSVVANFPEGETPDGLALDVHRNVWVTLNASNSIGRVSPSGSISIVAAGDPLDFPSSVAFGKSHGQKKTLFGVNFSISENLGLPAGEGPSVFSLQAGTPGVTLP
jgi:sugar lactone lactonase YvrE